VVVAHARHLAPRLRPPLIHRPLRLAHHSQAIAQRLRPLKLDAEHRRQQDRPFIAVKAVVELSAARFDGDLVSTVG
jgi:hypothetical protein